MVKCWYLYYVWFFDGYLVVWVDCKIDCVVDSLFVVGVFGEFDILLVMVVEGLVGELVLMVLWLGLGGIVVFIWGDLVGELCVVIKWING